MKKSPLSILLLASLLLSHAAFAAQNIVVFGDSLSAGYGIARDAGWVNLLALALAPTHPKLNVVNTSISGETSTGGRTRIAAVLAQHPAKVMIIELGANDALRGAQLNDVEKNLREIIQLAKKSGAKVLLLGMQLPPNYGLRYTQNFSALYPRIARQEKISLTPFMLAGIRAEQFQADNLHPDASAQAQILRNVMVQLKPLLH
ncbi:MAG: arylesterase [Sideroxydans sp.]|nr:arylesterase [Sideroxydans sp.]